MKALITDEYDEGASIIEGPEEIIKRLKEYLLEFDNYEHPGCWGTEEFINYLNDVILMKSDEKVIILELWIYDYDETLPKLKI
ncbi:hypothetical protein GOQ27_04550 [Clostridium sp. D2Q-11]|uniref:Uncharacterized protein n=1 Tax=Anaeromonas frigoriresistens TaxID=2683708 RepID=A0A942UR34_9FIRM|nr:hypothetical protein [Anaeromonas frigoriresistens]MBS4537719.1 hypothetical protein [Anaeromonas frigoriresistens]